ncbi:hypothetical protein BDN72DRAFT_392308 [Pluteus cervinus]|uniref:Uncharacterized protein n=1 Tax=Pluteus cervinus TaxID=181527 RepID=A0ACD3A9K7_9AGAR|nr:hypothetical protein BDN72DRAFT_392308 [Pluteus cervinus]
MNLPNPNPATDQPLFFTPLLSPTLPGQTFHMYHEKETRVSGMPWHCLHIKDWCKSQTLYTMTWEKGLSPPIFCDMFRASGCENICARITYDITNAESHKGCRMTIDGGTGTTVHTSPDRSKGWSPRRFTFGDRRFVWRHNGTEKDSGMLSSFFKMDELYEVIREWPVPVSLTGKVGDEVFDRPLAWGERTMLKYGGHVCTVQLAGGLDQLFREFILANMLGPLTLGLAFKDVTQNPPTPNPNRGAVVGPTDRPPRDPNQDIIDRIQVHIP